MREDRRESEDALLDDYETPGRDSVRDPSRA